MNASATKRLIKHGVLGVVLALLTACSDGAVPELGGGQPSKSPPTINSFTVVKVGDPEAKPGPAVTINAGESVELSWSVSGAESVALSGGGMAEKAVEAEGKEIVSDIQANQTYTLTATNQGVSAEPATVRVSVAAKGELTIKFWADPATIDSSIGQKTRLCFEVTPKEAQVALSDPLGTPIEILGQEVPLPLVEEPAGEELPEGLAASVRAKSLSLAPKGSAKAEEPGVEPAGPAQPTDPMTPIGPIMEANTGCSIDLSPAETTTYRLVATLADGTSKEATTEVKVEQALSVTLKAVDAEGNEKTSVAAAGTELTLTWEVSGSYDKVELHEEFMDKPIDNAPVDVTEATVNGQGQQKVTINSTTTYTVTASKGEASATAEVVITLEQPEVAPTLEVSADSIFPGESVALTVSGVGAGVQVVIRTEPDHREITVGEGGTASDTPGVTTSYQVVASVGGKEVVSNAKMVTVRGFDKMQLESKVGSAIATSPSGNVLLGFEADLSDGALNLVSVGGDGQGSTIAINYMSEFIKPGEGTWKYHKEIFEKLNPYTVNSIVVNAVKPEEVLVSTSGALFASADGGKTFQIVDAFRDLKKGDGSSRASCKGSQRKGLTSAEDGIFSGVRQVCDAIFLSGGKVALAYEAGVMVNANVFERAKDRNNSTYFWQGKKENALVNVMSHDLAVDSAGKTVYVASDKGVYKSEDDAKTFTEVVGVSGPVYAVAVASDGTVYAGTKDKLYKYTGGKWEEVSGISGAVYAIEEGATAQPAEGATPVASVIYVGTVNGLVVLRSGTATATISKQLGGADDKPVAVRAIAVQANPADADDEHLYVGTSNGVYLSHGAAHGAEAEGAAPHSHGEPQPPAEPAQPTEPPATPPAATAAVGQTH